MLEVSMRRLAKTATVAAVAACVLTLAACGSGRGSSAGASTSGSGASTAGFPAGSVIGVSLPQKTSENWVLAEGLFTQGLKAAGFIPKVTFANGGVTEQQNQIQSMVTNGAKVIV